MQLIDSSGIRRAFDLARKLKNPIDLSIGQPDFDPPAEIKRAAAEAIEGGRNRYTVTQGIEKLRHEVRRHLSNAGGYIPEEVMITSGAAGGIMLAFLALANPGDEVVIPDPYFVIYKHLCNLVGAVPRFVDTYPDFELTAERLEAALGPKTRMVIINSPSNPTGAVVGEDRMKEIALLCERKGITILSDEIYEFFSYDLQHVSFGRFSGSVLVIGGFSKSFGVPGWRVGYAAGPERILREMIKLQQYSFVCAPSPLQHALIGAYGIDMRAKVEDYRRKRETACNALSGCYKFIKPGGAFFLFPEAPGCDGEAFFEKALGRNLILVPGNVFSERDTHFRISFAVPDEVLHRGIEVLLSLA